MKEFSLICSFIIASQAILTKGCPPPAYALSIGNQGLPSAALLSALGGCGCPNSMVYDLPIGNPPPPAVIPAKIGCPGPAIYELVGNRLPTGPTVVPARVGRRGPIAYEVPISNQRPLPPAPVAAPSVGCPGPVAYGLPIGNPCLAAPPVIAPPPSCSCSRCHFLRKIPIPPPCI